METSTRNSWLAYMLRIVAPVLENLHEGKLHETIPTGFHNDRKEYILLEAFGRSICGIAPWLELEGLQGEEKQLFFRLDKRVQSNIIAALKASRKTVPCVSNWLLFSAMVEACLYRVGEADYDLVRVEYAVNMFQSWYLCSVAFLPLGLLPSHRFWAEENQDWTARKIWSGRNQPCDHAIPE